MKHSLLALAALAALVGATGCHGFGGHKHAHGHKHAAACRDCGHHGLLARFHHGCAGGACANGMGTAAAAAPVQAGPPSAQVAYPYYTTRGPRDFLNPNPPSIGY